MNYTGAIFVGKMQDENVILSALDLNHIVRLHEVMTVRRGYHENGGERWRTSQWSVYESSSHATQDEITPTPMQCKLQTQTHNTNILWLLYNVSSTWQLWLQVSYRIPTHPDYHSMHKGIDSLPLDTEECINALSIWSLIWPCRIFWKLLSCAGRKAWGRIIEISQPAAITNTKVTNTSKHLVEHAYAFAQI